MSFSGPTEIRKALKSLAGCGAEGAGARDGGLDGGTGAARDEKIARGVGAERRGMREISGLSVSPSVH